MKAIVIWMTDSASEWSLSVGLPIFFAVAVWRSSFFWVQSSLLIVLRCAFVGPGVDVREMHPNFVMATLVLVSQPQRAIRNGVGSIHPNLPFSFRFWWLQETAHVLPVSTTVWVPGGTGRFVLAKASSIMLVSWRSLPHGRRHAAPLKSPATVSTCSCSITVRTVSNNFFPIPRFLTNWLLMCNDIVVKNDLPLRGNLRNDAREMTACRTHPDCPTLTICCCPSLVSWR